MLCSVIDSSFSFIIWNGRFFSMNRELLSCSRDRPSSYGSGGYTVYSCAIVYQGEMLESHRIRPLLRLIRPDISTRGACRMAIDVLQDVLDTIRLHGLIAGIHTFTTPWGYTTTPDSQDIAFLVMVQGGGILEV